MSVADPAVNDPAVNDPAKAGVVPLLEMRHAGKAFRSRSGDVVALDDFSLVLDETPPRVVALAGESGSGKSTAANLVLGFLSPTSGEVLYRGSAVGRLKGRSYARFRQEVQAITQDPYSAFNPFYRVGRVFDTVLRNFPIATTDDDAMAKVVDAVTVVEGHTRNLWQRSIGSAATVIEDWSLMGFVAIVPALKP